MSRSDYAKFNRGRGDPRGMVSRHNDERLAATRDREPVEARARGGGRVDRKEPWARGRDAEGGQDHREIARDGIQSDGYAGMTTAKGPP